MHWLSSIHTWQGLLAALLLAPSPAFMVKHGDFKTCAQSGFCKRQQSFAQSRDGNTISWTYTVDPKTLRLGSASDSLLSATIKGQPAGTQNHDVLFSMELRAFTGGMRLLVKELNPLRPVYEGTAEYTLEHETAASFKPVKLVQDALKSTDAAPVYSFGNGNTLKLTLSPFSLEWTQGETPVLTFNERGYLYYEHAQAKAVPEPVLVKEGGDGAEAPPPPVKTYNETVAKVQLPDYLQADLWDESFGGKTDSKPFGKFARPLLERNSNAFMQDLRPWDWIFHFRDRTTCTGFQSMPLISLSKRRGTLFLIAYASTEKI